MTAIPDPQPVAGPPAIRRRPLWWRLWPLALLAAAMAAAWLLGFDRYFTWAALREHRLQLQTFADQHTVAAALAAFAVYAGAVALSIPGAVVLTVTVGFLFGTVVGGLIAVAGAAVGATGVFLLARCTVGCALAERAGPFRARMECGCREDAFSYLLALRLMPICPFWIVNLVPAVLGVPLRTYVLATVIGILPATFVFAALGAGLDSMLDHPDGLSAAMMLKPKIMLALGGLAALALLPVAFRRLRRRW